MDISYQSIVKSIVQSIVRLIDSLINENKTYDTK